MHHTKQLLLILATTRKIMTMPKTLINNQQQSLYLEREKVPGEFLSNRDASAEKLNLKSTPKTVSASSVD